MRVLHHVPDLRKAGVGKSNGRRDRQRRQVETETFLSAWTHEGISTAKALRRIG